MTAPSGLLSITAHIAGLQAQLDALDGISATKDSTDSRSGATFAAALADSSGTTTAAPVTAPSGGSSTVPTTTWATTALTGATAPVSVTATAAGGLAGGTAATPGGATGADIVNDAKRYLGIPYVWGGESAQGLDCSGLVQKTLGDLGISVPRVAADQAHAGSPVASLAQAQPGDLLFFGEPAYHVAIYAGAGQLIESPEPGKSVHLTDVYQTPTSIRRVVEQPGTLNPVGAASGAGGAALTAAGIYPAVAAFAGQFAAAEQTFGLPSGLLAAVAQQESGGNVTAVSPSGAQGLMQLLPSTAAAYGANAFDPAQAIQAAARIFSQNLGQFGGSVPLALAAYNAGAGAVRQYGGVPPYAETQNYVSRIMQTLGMGG